MRSRWNGPNSVASTIAATDMPLMSTNRRSSKVSRENTERRSSFAVSDRNRLNSEKVVRPIVREISVPYVVVGPGDDAEGADSQHEPEDAEPGQLLAGKDLLVGGPRLRAMRPGAGFP